VPLRTPSQLDELKTEFTPAVARSRTTTRQLSRKKFNDTDSLVRYHELLLFLRAYPHNAAIVRCAESELRGLRTSFVSGQQEIDLSPLQHPEVSALPELRY
jgi:hypothetical protein